MASNVSVALGEVTRPTKGFNIVLWILQILAAATFFLAGGSKLGGVAPMVEMFDKIGLGQVFTRYLAKELGPRKITANVVAPGPIQTDFSGGMVRGNPEVNKMISQMTALGRPGVADDIGPMIASLLSDENRWVNAQRIEVSGGLAL